MLVGMAGWLFTTLIFIFKAFPGNGEFAVRPALIWGAVLLVFYIAWITGMLNA